MNRNKDDINKGGGGGGGIKKYASVFSNPYLQQIHTWAKHMVQEHSAKGAQVPARTGGSHSLQTTRKMATARQMICNQTEKPVRLLP